MLQIHNVNVIKTAVITPGQSPLHFFYFTYVISLLTQNVERHSSGSLCYLHIWLGAYIIHTYTLTRVLQKQKRKNSPWAPLPSSAPIYSLQVICYGAWSCWCSHGASTWGQDCSLYTKLQFPHTDEAVALPLSSPTSESAPGLTHPKPKSACTSPTVGRWAASHPPINPHQTDSKEDKSSQFTGKLPCMTMNEWVYISGTETGMFRTEVRLYIISLSFLRYKSVKFFLVLFSGFVCLVFETGPC